LSAATRDNDIRRVYEKLSKTGGGGGGTNYADSIGRFKELNIR